jgi:hypothetical protein
MAIHTQRTPVADRMSYVNYRELVEIFRGDFAEVQKEQNQNITHIAFFNRLAPVVGSLCSLIIERLP